MVKIKAVGLLGLGANAVNAAALPQVAVPNLPVPLSLGGSTSVGVSPVANASAQGGVVVNPPTPTPPALTPPALPGLDSLPLPTAGLPSPALPAAGLPSLPVDVPGLPSLPEVPDVDGVLPAVPGVSSLPGVPGIDGLPAVPQVPSVSGLPLPSLPVPLPSTGGSVPSLPAVGDPESIKQKVCALGEQVLDIIVGGVANLLPGVRLPSLPSLPGLPSLSPPSLPSLPATPKLPNAPLHKRQATTSSAGTLPTPALAGGLAPASNPLGAVTGATNSLPVVGGLTGSLPLVGGGSSASPLGAVTGTLGGATSPLSGVTNTASGALNSVPVAGPVVGGAVSSLPLVGGGSSAGSSSPLSPVTGALGGVTGGGPLAGVSNTATGAISSLPVVGPTVAGAVNSLPVVGGGSGAPSAVGGPLGSVVGGVAPVTNAVSGLSSGPLAPATGALAPVGAVAGSALGAVQNAAGAVPVLGGTANQAVGAVQNAAGSVVPGMNPYPVSNGIPGTDPVGGVSIAIVSTLLSLLKKDPMSLFAPSFPVGPLVKRDAPHLEAQFKEEIRNLEKHEKHEKRQLPGLPSLSSGIPGIGVGSLPLSGIPGVSPDMAFLVGSIAKNLAVPGGQGLGSVTTNMLGLLNNVVPDFLFKLPVVQDSVPTFAVLQLLSSINPTKFASLGSLTNLPALQQAVSQLPAADLAILKQLPLPTDPSNLITTITALTDNILTVPGLVSNLKASVAALAMRNLGLSVPGLS